MDFNQTVEHYEKLQNDFEFLKKMNEHQNNKIKDLQIENDEIRK